MMSFLAILDVLWRCITRMGTVLTEVFLLVLTMFLLTGAIPLSACGEDETMIIDNGCILPNDDRENYSRYVNFRPADGAIVHSI
jgi:hypothetical protein